MRSRPLRQFILLLVFGAFLSAGAANAAWSLQAVPPAGMAMMHHGNGSMPMPCHGKSTAVDCMTDAGCIFTLAVPTPMPTQATVLIGWSRIRYSYLTPIIGGLPPEPPFDPPIFFG